MRGGFRITLALVSVAMLAPDLPGAPFPHADKLAHLCLFGGLAAAARLSGGSWRREPGPRALWLLALTMVLAIGFEAAQMLLPHRSTDVFDLLANLLGATLGWAAAHRAAPVLGRMVARA